MRETHGRAAGRLRPGGRGTSAASARGAPRWCSCRARGPYARPAPGRHHVAQEKLVERLALPRCGGELVSLNTERRSGNLNEAFVRRAVRAEENGGGGHAVPPEDADLDPTPLGCDGHNRAH